MKRKNRSLEKGVRYGMRISGCMLSLLLIGKGMGIAQWEFGAFPGKEAAAGYLLQLCRYHDPLRDRSRQPEPLESGVWEWIRSRNPVVRYLSQEQVEEEVALDEDPSYQHYLDQQVFYQEHEYLLWYGDEESGQQPGEAGEGAPGGGESGGSGASGSEGNGQGGESGGGGEVWQVASGKPGSSLPVIGKQYAMEQLADYDYLMKHFFNVHTSTTASREEMKAEVLLGKDLSLERDASKPQILIYHTHSQETFADHSGENPGANIVGVGDYLTQLLEAKGYQVIHNTETYDMKGGKLDRNKAYTYALEGVSRILEENPSIEVILDVHRDGVNENLHMVSEVNGKPTAPIMFFNGMSQTPDGPIEYLENPYKEDNLAFSLQMQLKAAAYFPDWTRKIYLKGLRYNLHLRPRSALIEVGAQTNTFEEAKNAMEPLAEVLDMVLQGM